MGHKSILFSRKVLFRSAKIKKKRRKRKCFDFFESRDKYPVVLLDTKLSYIEAALRKMASGAKHQNKYKEFILSK